MEILVTVRGATRGTVTPADAPLLVTRGSSPQITFTPNAGKSIRYVQINGTTVISNSTEPYIHTFTNIQDLQRVVVYFR